MMIQEKKLKSAFKKFCFAMDCRLHEKERLGYQGWDDKKFMVIIIDVFDKIIDLSNQGIDNIKSTLDKPDAAIMNAITALTVIAGAAGGAKSALKENSYGGSHE
jgi:hypothetical protein